MRSMDRCPSFESKPLFNDIGIGHRNFPDVVTRRAAIERLSTPKIKDKRWIPDRPSVYWLDHLIDPTPHKIKDPQELASYYDDFEPKFPRMRLLSAPRQHFDDDNNNLNKPISASTGIPISALTYNASDRIRELARPKTAAFPKNVDVNGNIFTGTSGTKLAPTTISRQSLPTGRSHSPKGRVQYFDPNLDLARGDFPSRSKHTFHAYGASRERAGATRTPNNNVVDSKNNFINLRSRSSSSYHKTGSTVTRDILRNEKKKRPMSRTLYSSVRH